MITRYQAKGRFWINVNAVNKHSITNINSVNIRRLFPSAPAMLQGVTKGESRSERDPR
jgi:hypothetical protein